MFDTGAVINESPHDAPAPLPVLWLCGAPGTGKSVIAWELFRDHAEPQVAYVDIDQLKMLVPEPDDPFKVAVANLSAFLDVHRRIGTQAVIVSGVIDPEQVPVLEAEVGDRAAITWCLVVAEDDVLRRRIRDRGWPEELVDLVLGDARAWRAAPHGPVIDTTSTTPAEAARYASAHLNLLSPGQNSLPDTEEHASADDPDLVVIHGPRAVGKSTISWGLFWQRAQHGEPTGYLDADQLGSSTPTMPCATAPSVTPSGRWPGRSQEPEPRAPS